MATKAQTAEPVEVSDILEETSQVIEDTLDLLEAKTRWANNPKFLLTSALVGGVVIGSIATYLVAKKRITAKEQARADAEIEDVKRHYSGVPIVAPKPDLAELAERADAKDTVEQIKDDRGYAHYNSVVLEDEIPADVVVTPVTQEPNPPTVIEQNVFESDQPDTYWDWDEENARREERPEQPYVITVDEFNENETNFEQVSLTYYDGDGVLTDNMDQIVNDESIVGAENLLRFGHASQDPKVVYVRNNKLGADFEVAYSPNKYSHEVLGVRDDEPELRHSSGRPLRFRDRHDG